MSGDKGLRSDRHRSLVAKMPKTKTKKPRNVKGVASRGRWKRRILIVLVVVLLVPPMQIAVVRFVDPPRTVSMWGLKMTNDE